MIAPDLKEIILIQELSTGYILTYQQPQGKAFNTKAFHHGEEAKMLNELINTLGMKYDYQVTDRRTNSVTV